MVPVTTVKEMYDVKYVEEKMDTRSAVVDAITASPGHYCETGMVMEENTPGRAATFHAQAVPKGCGFRGRKH